MRISKYPDRKDWKDLLQRPLIDFSSLEASVSRILNRVRNEGEKALKEFTEKFDGWKPGSLEVGEEEIRSASARVSSELRLAIDRAAANIRRFHEAQQPRPIRMETSPGVQCRIEYLPLERVGLYIPGGSAPLFSTVLMLALPAKVAGCRELILCTPPARDGSIHPAILYAASMAGVNRVFRCGGAQAIAAMAYGAGPVPATDKIFGPGNQYVTMAKQLVMREGIPIDMPAGPSEVAILADHTADPAFLAADLLSQAEHGPDSQVLLVTSHEELIERVVEETYQQLENLPRKETARKSLENSRIFLVKTLEDGMELINLYAPEHLIISTENYREDARMVKNAGSVFLGPYTPESAGDYASGTNHTLPTNGYARSWSGVTLGSFLKSITFQEISPAGLLDLGPVIETMAAAEELQAHKNAVTLRLEKIRKS